MIATIKLVYLSGVLGLREGEREFKQMHSQRGDVVAHDGAVNRLVQDVEDQAV